MKKLFVICFTSLLSLGGFAQFRHSLELSTAQALAVNINPLYKIHFAKGSAAYFAPQVGLGQMLLWGS